MERTPNATLRSGNLSVALLEPKIIAFDSSRWAKWLDAVSAQNDARRERARTLHARLLDQGHIPLLTWHHFEELLGGEDDAAMPPPFIHQHSILFLTGR